MVADAFWSFKEFSIAFGLFTLAILSVGLFLNNNRLRNVASIVYLSAFFTCLAFTTLIASSDSESAGVFFKITINIGAIFLGTIWGLRDKESQILGYTAVIYCCILICAEILGFGTTAWGRQYTFTGPYFFKTDLCFAILVCLTFSLFFTKKISIELFAACLSLYLIIRADSRLGLGLYVMLIGVWLHFRLKTSGISGNYWFTLTSILITPFLALTAFAIMSDLGGSSINFDRFWSSSNLRARDVIWEEILRYRESGTITERLFGFGFSVVSNEITYHSVILRDNFRSHNGYLFLLITTGLTGLVCFLTIVGIMFKNSLAIILTRHRHPERVVRLAYCSASLLLIVCLGSTTVELFRYNHTVWPMFFMAGALLNEINDLDNKAKTYKKNHPNHA